MESQETAGRHERKREEQDPGVPAPVGSLPGRIAENERHSPYDSKYDKMDPVVLEVRVKLRVKQQRDEPD